MTCIWERQRYLLRKAYTGCERVLILRRENRQDEDADGNKHCLRKRADQLPKGSDSMTTQDIQRVPGDLQPTDHQIQKGIRKKIFTFYWKTMLKLHQKFWQIYTRSWDIYDMPPSVTKEQITQLVATSRFLDVGDELIPIDQIKSIKLNHISDAVDLMIANLPQTERYQARHFVTQRKKEWLKVSTEILQNYLSKLN